METVAKLIFTSQEDPTKSLEITKMAGGQFLTETINGTPVTLSAGDMAKVQIFLQACARL